MFKLLPTPWPASTMISVMPMAIMTDWPVLRIERLERLFTEAPS